MHWLTGGRQDGGVNARDRDGEGRARSARPRDGLGRPLPYGTQGVERQPEGVPRSPGETVAEAQRLLDAGMPFHAHEVFEDAWKSGPDAEAALWRGLAQLAVGLTHAARGNAVGGARLLRRGADVLAGRTGPGDGDGDGETLGSGTAYGMDLPGLVRWARELAGRVEGGAAVDAATEAPRLKHT
ncbi:DUF309 domain-containing protein [Streptomyces sp. ISL-66]|uniref:DUF309 domain-containing protein n=1 Tax=Streptomyces sp. ISL-66 TaxID=2819186 RepID=UPI001BEB9B82|nr:DUF309 domain-containing protein [Streptomyces sp. ISL-66]MBT2468189.1 DUF309 domain-containing protein [Streptomyces sp. ISL-66]